MIEINVLTALPHLGLAVLCYAVQWFLYRYVLHPDYRWHQEGNTCHEDARSFAMLYGLVTFVVAELLINKVVVFTT